MSQNSIKSLLSLWSRKCDILDIELIIAHVLKKNKVFVMTHPEYILTANKWAQITLLCKKRAQNYPLAYILGYKEFYSRNFIINKHVLVPRPETELLIEKTIQSISKAKLNNILILDIGTGSGIIAITLAKELEKHKVKIIATDISNKALSLAKLNAHLHKVDIKFYNSNLLNNSSLQNDIIQTNSTSIIIVSNLPYVDLKQKEYLLSQPESQALYFEPFNALWSKDNGLSHYKKLITQTITTISNNSLKNINIISFYEIDSKQLEPLTKYLNSKLSDNDFNIRYFKDLSMKNRVLKWTF